MKKLIIMLIVAIFVLLLSIIGKIQWDKYELTKLVPRDIPGLKEVYRWTGKNPIGGYNFIALRYEPQDDLKNYVSEVTLSIDKTNTLENAMKIIDTDSKVYSNDWGEFKIDGLSVYTGYFLLSEGDASYHIVWQKDGFLFSISSKIYNIDNKKIFNKEKLFEITKKAAETIINK
jgi:hypothetical protein